VLVGGNLDACRLIATLLQMASEFVSGAKPWDGILSSARYEKDLVPRQFE
jgi:hypothetical protein